MAVYVAIKNYANKVCRKTSREVENISQHWRIIKLTESMPHCRVTVVTS